MKWRKVECLLFSFFNVSVCLKIFIIKCYQKKREKQLSSSLCERGFVVLGNHELWRSLW